MAHCRSGGPDCPPKAVVYDYVNGWLPPPPEPPPPAPCPRCGRPAEVEHIAVVFDENWQGNTDRIAKLQAAEQEAK